MTSAVPESPAVRLAGVDKSFGATRALDGASLVLRHGTVHALLGGNGSGKSTAIKILAGVYPADAGTIAVGRREWSADSYDAKAGRVAGLRFVHQDLGIFNELSVAENFALDAGWPTGRMSRIHWRGLHRRVAQILERFEIPATPGMPAGQLRPAQRTMLAIARALQDVGEGTEQRGILVLDEPTATLPQHESEVLLRAVRRRADLGDTVLMVSHRMQEVLSVAHDVTVFRDGRTVATLVDSSPTEEDVIALMSGRELVQTLAPRPASEQRARVDEEARPILRVRELVSGPLRGADLTVRAGEIVGLTGLVGSGRTSLLKTVFGHHRPASGVIEIDGRPQNGREDAKSRMRLGVGYVAEDRVGESVFMDLTVRENLSSAVLRRYWGITGMSRRAERAAASRLIAEYAVKTQSQDAVMTSLSGGNQQKAILARWLQRKPQLLLLDEPTQGVDVMSRKEIYETVRATAGQGTAVLVSSSDFVELCSLCDRVLVLRNGRVVTELSGDELEPDNLTAATQSSSTTTGPGATP